MWILDWLWNDALKRNFENDQGQHHSSALLNSEGQCQSTRPSSVHGTHCCGNRASVPKSPNLAYLPIPGISLDTIVLCVEEQVPSTDRLAGEPNRTKFPKGNFRVIDKEKMQSTPKFCLFPSVSFLLATLDTNKQKFISFSCALLGDESGVLYACKISTVMPNAGHIHSPGANWLYRLWLTLALLSKISLYFSPGGLVYSLVFLK